ncbi:chaperone modulator CbpM [Eudoraea chungangensis]|uniref:chaperone modulator CbpM n=1 Tax=Eudoraea chungangensis TaxID=1481905 RepID=UPI0023ECC1F2|nr:chaperone modulator CbpM [Eudoraea chungangensis]
MKQEKLISIRQLCDHYQIEMSFFEALQEEGLLRMTYASNNYFLEQDAMHRAEKIIRIHKELNINVEGIDVVFNLLQKVDNLQQEMLQMQNKLNLYEGESFFS